MTTQFSTLEELDAYHAQIRREHGRHNGQTMINVGIASISAMGLVLWIVGTYDIIDGNRLALGVAFGMPLTMLLALITAGVVIKCRNREV